MSRWERLLQYGANTLVVGTGVIYAVMRYFMTPVDEWAVINHPWQPHVQHLHVLTAPLLVFACGLIWRRHVADRMRANERRRGLSGPGLAVAFVPMIASGYLLQTASSAGWRRTWLVVHLVTSILWILLISAHFLGRRIARTSEWATPLPAERPAGAIVCRSSVSDRSQRDATVGSLGDPGRPSP